MFNKILEDFEKSVPSAIFEKVELNETLSDAAKSIIHNINYRIGGGTGLRSAIARAFQFMSKPHKLNTPVEKLEELYYDEVVSYLKYSMNTEYQSLKEPYPIHKVQNVTESGEIYDKQNFDANDPEVLIAGGGRMLLSQIKNKAANMLERLSKEARNGDAANILSELNSGTVMHYLQAIADVEEELSSPQMKRKATLRNKMS